jgi:hypothetical protein
VKSWNVLTVGRLLSSESCNTLVAPVQEPAEKSSV